MESASFGGYATVYVVQGQVPDYASGGRFIDEELWVGTDNGPPGSYWVEVGYCYGEVAGDYSPGPNWFWADNRPNGGGYHEHIPSLPDPTHYWDQNIPVAAAYAGNNTWNIYIDGTGQGVSTANPGVSDFLQTGLEAFTASDASHLSGSVDGSMKWQDYLGGWHNDWPSATTYVNSPATGAWYITDYVWTNSFN
jgi:hypothetical protein